HITCAITPREGRGSNFVLKLDDRTLPTGFRLSTEPMQVKRATRGKAIEFNFGASIHRVIGLDLADPVFEPGTAELREIWRLRRCGCRISRTTRIRASSTGVSRP